MTWEIPNSRIRTNLVIYRNDKIDSIPFGGFGCGTGIYLTPLKNKKIAGSKKWNPLMFNPYTNYPLPLKSEKFPQLFKKIYGDSISIQFEQATYSLPWSKYPSQMIKSDEIIVSTEKIIDNWKKGNYSLSREFDEEYEEALFIGNKE